MELKDTIKLMESKDYKEHFKAEFYQLQIREQKLCAMLRDWDKLDFEPNCSKKLLAKQLEAMQIYERILKQRAIEENIIL